MPETITAFEQLPQSPLSKHLVIPPIERTMAAVPTVAVAGQKLDVTLTASGALSVELFNSAEDTDAARVFGRRGSPPPPIEFAEQCAWLKYAFTGLVKSNAGLPIAGLTATASREAVFADYRRHHAAETLRSAIVADRPGSRSILDVAGVAQLAPGEALSMQIDGRLAVDVTFSWADALSSASAELANNLGSDTPIAFTLDAGAEATCGIEVADDFTFIVSRMAAGNYRISVKKGHSRGAQVAVRARLGVEFENSPDVETALTAIVEGALGMELSAVDALLARVQTEPAGLTEEESELYSALVERLHLAHALKEVQAVKYEIARLVDRVRTTVTQVATSKATVGFKYEYARLTEETMLLDFELLDPRELRSNGATPGAYDLAIGGNVRELTRRAVSTPAAYRIIRFLDETTLTRRRSLGFTLGLGRHVVQASDRNELKAVTRTDAQGRKMLAFAGARAYVEKGLPSPDFTWTVDLKAEMSAFSSNPQTDQFDFGLHLQLDFPVVAAGDAERLADFAAMWDAVASVPAAQQSIRTFLGNDRGDATLQLIFDRRSLSAALAMPRRDDAAAWGDAFGAAMPYLDTFETRRSHLLRRAAYGPLWTDYFTASDPEPSLSYWRGRMSTAISEGGLRNFETSSMPNTFSNMLVTQYPHVRAERASFADGAKALSNAMRQPSSPAVIPQAFAAMEQLWSQRPFIAAAGVFLAERARRATALASVTRTLTVRRGQQSLILTSPS